MTRARLYLWGAIVALTVVWHVLQLLVALK